MEIINGYIRDIADIDMSTVAATETGVTAKPDHRIPACAGEKSQTCRGWREGFEQKGCKWYAESRYFGCCTYDRFGVLCDKVVVDGKGVN